MADDTKRTDLNDSTQPEAMSSNAGAAPESKQDEFSAQPEAAEILEKSLQPAGSQATARSGRDRSEHAARSHAFDDAAGISAAG